MCKPQFMQSFPLACSKMYLRQPECLFVGAVPMATAQWDVCQCGVVVLVSLRKMTVLQQFPVVEFLYSTWKAEEWEENERGHLSVSNFKATLYALFLCSGDLLALHQLMFNKVLKLLRTTSVYSNLYFVCGF